jgi:hypothetical protein
LSPRTTGGDIRDWNLLIDALATMYPTPQPEPRRVQVMTLHKAKGLEFDTVILPAWREILRATTRNCCVGARARAVCSWRPSARGGDADPIYAYLDLSGRKPITSSVACFTSARRAPGRGCTSSRPPRSPKDDGMEGAALKLRAGKTVAWCWRLGRSRPLRRVPLRMRRAIAAAARFPAGSRCLRFRDDRMPAAALAARSPVVPFSGRRYRRRRHGHASLAGAAAKAKARRWNTSA